MPTHLTLLSSYQPSHLSVGNRLIFVVILVASMFCPVVSAAEPDLPPELAARIRDAGGRVTDFMDEEGVIGAAVALVVDGHVWSSGFGSASVIEGRSFTAHTVNAMHELAKLFTAVAIMQLVERGDIDLDAPLNRYLPAFRPHGGNLGESAITVRQLLSHHSGLPSEYTPGFELAPGDEPLPQDWDQAWRGVLDKSGDIALISPPGELYGYSSLGYTLLGLLVERISGMYYTDYVTANILAPLGMSNTYFGDVGEAAGDFSSAFDGRREETHSVFRDLPANGLVSTAHDMALFMRALVTGGDGIIGSDVLAEMFRPQNTDVLLDGAFRIGLGFFATPTTGGTFREAQSISHSADMGKAQSYFIALPGAGLAVLVTTNSDVSTAALRRTADVLLQNLLPDTTVASLRPYSPHESVPLDREASRSLEGTFSGVAGIYEVALRGDRLKLLLPKFPILNITLLPREDDFYGVRIRLFGLLSLRAFPAIREYESSLEARLVNVNGENILQWYYQGTTSFVSMSQVKPVAKDSAYRRWLEVTGEYSSASLAVDSVLEYDADLEAFLFGHKRGFLDFDTIPAQVYCRATVTELSHCGKGLDPPGVKNKLRLLADGRLLDAYGNYYSRVEQ